MPKKILLVSAYMCRNRSAPTAEMMRELWGNHGNTPVKFWQQGFAPFVAAACVGSKDLYKLYDLFDGVGSEALEGSMMKSGRAGFVRFVPVRFVAGSDLCDLFDGVGSEPLEGSMMKAAAPDLYDLFR